MEFSSVQMMVTSSCWTKYMHRCWQMRIAHSLRVVYVKQSLDFARSTNKYSRISEQGLEFDGETWATMLEKVHKIDRQIK